MKTTEKIQNSILFDDFKFVILNKNCGIRNLSFAAIQVTLRDKSFGTIVALSA